MKLLEIFDIYIVNLPEMLIVNTRTARVLFSGSAKFGSEGWYCRGCYYGRGCYYDLIPTPKKKSYWGMSNAYYPMKLMKYDKSKYYTFLLQISRLLIQCHWSIGKWYFSLVLRSSTFVSIPHPVAGKHMHVILIWWFGSYTICAHSMQIFTLQKI